MTFDLTGRTAVVFGGSSGTFNVFRQSRRHLARGASIMAIGAPQAAIAMRYQSHVCAAKAGVDQLVKVLALEWGPEEIRVNAIAPGFVQHTEGLERLSSRGNDPALLVPLRIGDFSRCRASGPVLGLVSSGSYLRSCHPL